jgi:hypothetical protein
MSGVSIWVVIHLKITRNASVSIKAIVVGKGRISLMPNGTNDRRRGLFVCGIHVDIEDSIRASFVMTGCISTLSRVVADRGTVESRELGAGLAVSK